MRLALQQWSQRQHPLADALHHHEPRQPGRQRDRHQQQHHHEQVRPQRTEPGAERIAHQPAQDAARASHVAIEQAQVQEAGRGNQEADHADQAQGRAQVGLGLPFLVHAEQGDPSHCAQHHRQQEGHVAKQLQQHIGNPGTYPAAHVVHRCDHAAGLRPARVRRRIGEQARQQVQQQRRNRDQRQIAPELLATGSVRGRRLARRRLALCGLAAFGNLLCHL